MSVLLDEILNENFEGFHRSLGYGKPLAAPGEMESRETPQPAWHRSLGKGIALPAQNNLLELEGEFVGTDDRVRIGNTRKVPFRWITCLDLIYSDPDMPGGTILFRGSGTLISPRHILTAGHCLYDDVTGSRKINTSKLQPLGVKAYFGRSGSYWFASSNASTWKTHPTWLASMDYRFDLGLIKLQSRVGDTAYTALEGQKLGYWGSTTDGQGSRIIPFDKAQVLNKKVNVAGYPGDKSEWLMWSNDKVINTNPLAGGEFIYYLADTCGGQSGCPVWLTNESTGGRFLIAVHTGPCLIRGTGADCQLVHGGGSCFGAPQRTSNRGVFLPKNVIDLIYQWVRTT